MDLFEVLGSLNKISIFFFIVTLGVLGYELYVFQKEKRQKTKPKIPKFTAVKSVQPQSTSPSLVSEKQKPLKKRKNLTVILAAVLVAVLGSALYFTIQQTETPQEPPPPVSTRATSEDITPPVASESASPLFITPTTGESQTASSSSTTENLTQVEATAAPTVSPTGGIGGNATVTSTVTPTSVVAASTKSATSTPTASPASTNQPTAETLPVAGFAYPQMFVLFFGAAIVFFSILF